MLLLTLALYLSTFDGLCFIWTRLLTKVGDR